MRLLIGGSPCTYWSIAQTKNRETEASGMGWELFRNYVIARDKLQPDYFLYENNKSMAAAIREQITAMLGVEPVCINSALVSAQNRQRLYWVGRRRPDGTYEQVPVEQPEDKGILLRDVLETTVAERGYALTEPLITTPDGKSFCVTATEYKGSSAQQTLTKHRRTMVAEPVRIGTIESNAKNADFDSQQYRVYPPGGKSVTLCGNGGGVGAKTGLYAIPTSVRLRGRNGVAKWEARDDGKAGVLDKNVARSGTIVEPITGKEPSAYEVRDGQITIKGKQYSIKLADGWYIIRKLTVKECMRLQTVPETFEFPVSDSQAYKMLGNGWMVDVIAHIMSHFEGVTTEPLDVLSMYDGMACGHIALDKLGANVRNYYATEIDKYAIATARHNFPDIVELGDAFQVREIGWGLTEGQIDLLEEMAELERRAAV